jgi:hypothetical protein
MALYMTTHPELCHTAQPCRIPPQLADVKALNIFGINYFSLARSLMRGNLVTRGEIEKHGNAKLDVVALVTPFLN